MHLGCACSLTESDKPARALWLLPGSLPVYTKLDWGLVLVWSLTEQNCAGPGSTKEPGVLRAPTPGCCWVSCLLSCCVGWLLQVCAHIGRLNCVVNTCMLLALAAAVMVHLTGLVGHGKSCNVLRPAPHTAALTDHRAKLPAAVAASSIHSCPVPAPGCFVCVTPPAHSIWQLARIRAHD